MVKVRGESVGQEHLQAGQKQTGDLHYQDLDREEYKQSWHDFSFQHIENMDEVFEALDNKLYSDKQKKTLIYDAVWNVVCMQGGWSKEKREQIIKNFFQVDPDATENALAGSVSHQIADGYPDISQEWSGGYRDATVDKNIPIYGIELSDERLEVARMDGMSRGVAEHRISIDSAKTLARIWELKYPSEEVVARQKRFIETIIFYEKKRAEQSSETPRPIEKLWQDARILPYHVTMETLCRLEPDIKQMMDMLARPKNPISDTIQRSVASSPTFNGARDGALAESLVTSFTDSQALPFLIGKENILVGEYQHHIQGGYNRFKKSKSGDWSVAHYLSSGQNPTDFAEVDEDFCSMENYNDWLNSVYEQITKKDL